jgi:hypothetical protein
MLIGIVAAMAVVVALAASGFFAISRLAHASPVTLYVGASASTNSGCASPGYTSVQAAVNAAPNNATVYLCAGGSPYHEQFIVSNRVNLTGDPGATIAAPSTFPTNPNLPPQFSNDNLFKPQAIVILWGSNAHLSTEGITIAGPLPGNGGCAEAEYGVLAIDDATLTMDHTIVRDIHDSNASLYGCQFGIGVQVGRQNWPKADFSSFVTENFVGHATITHSTVEGYQKNGIDIDSAHSSGDVDKNVVSGSGRDTQFAVIIAQNGIEIARGASSTVRDNVVWGNTYTGTAPAFSTGILVYGGCPGDPLTKNTQITGNILINNDVGVALANYSGDCSLDWPPSATTATNIDVSDNKISNDQITNRGPHQVPGYVGYQAGISDVGNHDTIADNEIFSAGYGVHQVPGKAFVLPIDTTSAPAINPRVHGNDIDAVP